MNVKTRSGYFAYDSDCPMCGTIQRDFHNCYKRKLKVRCGNCGCTYFVPCTGIKQAFENSIGRDNK
jgi:hypothetical protein